MGCKHIINDTEGNTGSKMGLVCSKCGINCELCQGCGHITSARVICKNMGFCTKCYTDDDNEWKQDDGDDGDDGDEEYEPDEADEEYEPDELCAKENEGFMGMNGPLLAPIEINNDDKFIINIFELLSNNKPKMAKKSLKRKNCFEYPYSNTEEYESGLYTIRKINHIDSDSSKCLVEWEDDYVTWEKLNDMKSTEAYKKYKK